MTAIDKLYLFEILSQFVGRNREAHGCISNDWMKDRFALGYDYALRDIMKAVGISDLSPATHLELKRSVEEAEK